MGAAVFSECWELQWRNDLADARQRAGRGLVFFAVATLVAWFVLRAT